jgi:hypothetical protein
MKILLKNKTTLLITLILTANLYAQNSTKSGHLIYLDTKIKDLNNDCENKKVLDSCIELNNIETFVAPKSVPENKLKGNTLISYYTDHDVLKIKLPWETLPIHFNFWYLFKGTKELLNAWNELNRYHQSDRPEYAIVFSKEYELEHKPPKDYVILIIDTFEKKSLRTEEIINKHAHKIFNENSTEATTKETTPFHFEFYQKEKDNRISHSYVVISMYSNYVTEFKITGSVEDKDFLADRIKEIKENVSYSEIGKYRILLAK